jgi:predicted AlkP superfamily pyrophosphatase or phosphodiesterase
MAVIARGMDRSGLGGVFRTKVGGAVERMQEGYGKPGDLALRLEAAGTPGLPRFRDLIPMGRLRRITHTLVVLLATAWLVAASAQAQQEASPSPPGPRLILQITIDQLRGDLPTRYYDRLGAGGFRYLLEQGIVFTDAHHAHANTETIVGHTTLSTGADPAMHGMVGNVWFDREKGRLTYNIEDPAFPLLIEGGGVDQATEIDPTQRTARSDGRSPMAILTSTFSDELAIRTAGRAKIFGVSVKDRGAVAMAGHAGKAFWFSKATGRFVSSRFYYDALPNWVVEYNRASPTGRFADGTWELLHDRATYLFGQADDNPWEMDLAGFGRTFPHAFGGMDGRYFTTLLTTSPAGDELVLDFAKAVIENEDLGADVVPDYLSVSFSSTDYVGHLFGPSSLEAEDNLLRLDRVLADLLADVDARVGLDNTLIVFSADHGAAEAPGYLNQLGIDAGYFDTEALDRQPAIEALERRFGVGGELIETFFQPYVYLNQDVIQAHGLDPAEVEGAVAEEIQKFDGIALAVSSIALREGRVPDTPLHRSVLRNFHPKRSGDIYVVLEPHWFINDFDGLRVAVHHGSPWQYDTYVPVIFGGAGLPARHVHRRVQTVDVATTLAAYLGTKPPSGAAGAVLTEVLEAGRE